MANQGVRRKVTSRRLTMSRAAAMSWAALTNTVAYPECVP
jgi:hypothetical protein